MEEGETLALVGESGCGKSTLGRLMLTYVGPFKAYFRSKSIQEKRRMDYEQVGV